MSVTTAMTPTPAAVAAGDFVENEIFRLEIERLVAAGVVTWRGLAREVGIDERGFAISFGHGHASGRSPARYVRYERAVEVARLIGLDPVDVGL